jgi:hypothetical protein
MHAVLSHSGEGARRLRHDHFAHCRTRVRRGHVTQVPRRLDSPLSRRHRKSLSLPAASRGETALERESSRPPGMSVPTILRPAYARGAKPRAPVGPVDRLPGHERSCLADGVLETVDCLRTSGSDRDGPLHTLSGRQRRHSTVSITLSARQLRSCPGRQSTGPTGARGFTRRAHAGRMAVGTDIPGGRDDSRSGPLHRGS